MPKNDFPQQPAEKPATPMQKDLQAWDRKQAEYIHRYGPAVMQDREFLRAKFEVCQHIRDKYSNATLSMDDKIERSILKGQVKQLRIRLYPNNFVRRFVQLKEFLGKLLSDKDALGEQRYQSKEVQRPKAVQRLSGEHNGVQQSTQRATSEEQLTARHLQRDRVLTDMPIQNGVAIK